MALLPAEARRTRMAVHICPCMLDYPICHARVPRQLRELSCTNSHKEPDAMALCLV